MNIPTPSFESDDADPDGSTKALEKMKDVAHRLMEEHDLDSIQIISTLKFGWKTRRLDHGVGNWYARLGSVKEWVDDADEINRTATRRRDD